MIKVTTLGNPVIILTGLYELDGKAGVYLLEEKNVTIPSHGNLTDTNSVMLLTVGLS